MTTKPRTYYSDTLDRQVTIPEATHYQLHNEAVCGATGVEITLHDGLVDCPECLHLMGLI
jgi:hypothetical protein